MTAKLAITPTSRRLFMLSILLASNSKESAGVEIILGGKALLTIWELGGKKFGVGNGDLNLRSQPRLPGSVVGETSMSEKREGSKITQVTVPWSPEASLRAPGGAGA
jgi:hypothetical protein